MLGQDPPQHRAVEDVRPDLGKQPQPLQAILAVLQEHKEVLAGDERTWAAQLHTALAVRATAVAAGATAGPAGLLAKELTRIRPQLWALLEDLQPGQQQAWQACTRLSRLASRASGAGLGMCLGRRSSAPSR